jgi:BioD-like phosphotransacetylase family protein
MMRPYKVTNPQQSLILPATAAAVGGTAVALSLAYYYQQKRKRKAKNKGSLNQSVSLDGQTEMLQNPE